MKKVAKTFGSFEYFLYLCIIIKKRETATRCSWLT